MKFKQFLKLIPPERILAIIIATVSVLIASSYVLSFYAKTITTYFAYGRSFSQLFFFLTWLTVAMYIAGGKSIDLSARSIKLTILIALFISVLLSISTTLWLYYVSGIPLDEPVLAVCEGVVSKTTLGHTHTTKAILALVEHIVLGHARFGYYDSGYPYYKFFPLWIEGICLATIIVLTTSLLAWIPRLKEQFSNRDYFGVLTVYVLTSFVVLKASVDGGFLSFQSGMYCALLIRLLFIKRIGSFALPTPFLVWMIVGSVPGMVTLFIESDSFLLDPIIQVADFFIPPLLVVCVYCGVGVFYELVQLASEGIKRIHVRTYMQAVLLFISLLGLINFSPVLAWSRGDLSINKRQLHAGDSVNIISPKDTNFQLGATCEGQICLINEKLTSDITVSALYEKYHLRPGLLLYTVEPKADYNQHSKLFKAEVKLTKGDLPVGYFQQKIIDEIVITNCNNLEWCSKRIEARLTKATPLQKDNQIELVNGLGLLSKEVLFYRNEHVN